MKLKLTGQPEHDSRQKIDPEDAAERAERLRHGMSRGMWRAMTKPQVSIEDYRRAKQADEERELRRQRGQGKR